jgi:hypothetical protein
MGRPGRGVGRSYVALRRVDFEFARNYLRDQRSARLSFLLGREGICCRAQEGRHTATCRVRLSRHAAACRCLSGVKARLRILLFLCDKCRDQPRLVAVSRDSVVN